MVALNLMDAAREQGTPPDPDRVWRALGVPAVGVSAATGEGMAALGRTVRAVIDVALPPGGDPAAFEARLADRTEVTFAAYVTGPADYTVLADCAGPEGLDVLVRWLKAEGGAARTESKVVLRRVIG